MNGPAIHSSPSSGVPSGIRFATHAAWTLRSATRPYPARMDSTRAIRCAAASAANAGAPVRRRATAASSSVWSEVVGGLAIAATAVVQP